MKRLENYLKSMLEALFLDTTNRLCIQLQLFCIAASVIAVIMTVLNCVKAEYQLGLETGIGAAVTVLIYLHAAKTRKYLPGSLGIAVIFLGLLSVFLISGAVEGFAVLWFCLYPFICLFILDMKGALLFIFLGFLMLASFMWTPLKEALPPVYTRNFLLRFPLLYIGNFAFALALNGFYSYTYNRLLRMNRKFERLSNQDGLTKLANRTYLEEYKRGLLKKGGAELSSVMLDVDYFKQYNDTYGHLAGDEVLKTLAREILALLPEEDGIAVRYGGEEFLILFPEWGIEKTAEFANRLRGHVNGLKIPHSATSGWLSVSIGVSSRIVASKEEFLELLKQTDDALYSAKQNGRNRVEVG